jgi:hypothetical protein
VKLVYRPEDGQEQSWVYKPGKVRAAQAEQLERRVGLSWDEFNRQLANGSVQCRRALLWHFQRQDHPTLRFEDVDFAVGELRMEFDREEIGQIRAEIAKAKLPDGIPEATRKAVLDGLDQEAEQAPEPPGKAPASSGG